MPPRIPLLPAPVRWLPAVAVAALICYWSLVTTPPTTLPVSLSFPSATADPTVTTSGPDISAATLGLEFSDPHVRHAIAYATLGFTLAYGLSDSERPILRKALLVFAVATGYGALMEAGQLFVPERTASLVDVAANAVGAAVALSWYGLERRARVVPVLEPTPETPT